MFDISKGVALIKQYEGCRLIEYKDICGLLTIGWGHRILPSENFSSGITQKAADKILDNDVTPLVNYLSGISALNDNQRNALLDFGFNLGIGSLKTLLGHGIDQVPVQIIRWDKANGKENSALLKRRQAELSLFNS